MELVWACDGALFAVAVACALRSNPPRNTQPELYGPQVSGPTAALRTNYKALL